MKPRLCGQHGPGNTVARAFWQILDIGMPRALQAPCCMNHHMPMAYLYRSSDAILQTKELRFVIGFTLSPFQNMCYVSADCLPRRRKDLPSATYVGRMRWLKNTSSSI
jgi:hypothetical protein